MQNKSRQPKLRRRVWLILSIMGGIVTALCIGTMIITVATTPTQTQAPTPTTKPVSAVATAPTHASTSTPSPTPTPNPSPTATPYGATHGIPHLGGPLSDFIGEYGQPNNDSSPPADYHFLHVVNSYLDGLVVSVYPGTQKVDYIVMQATNGDSQTDIVGWTASYAESLCMDFAPSDAHFKQRITYLDGTGYDFIFTSMSLAHLIPADDFSDGNGGMVPRGTFDMSYLYANDGQHIGSCSMMTGEQQTQD